MNPIVKEKLDHFARDLRTLFGGQLVSVCGYGPAAVNTTLPTGKSPKPTVQALVILKTVTTADLEKVADICRKWEAFAQELPVFMSLEEWHQSNDVFALEYLSVRQSHYLAYGDDLFSQAAVDNDALRLICELELHRKLIFFRQRLLLFDRKPERLLAILTHDIHWLATVFRSVIQLHHAEPQGRQTDRDVFRGLTEFIADYRPEPFETILNAANTGQKIQKSDILPLYKRFLKELERVTADIDTCFGFLTKQPAS